MRVGLEMKKWFAFHSLSTVFALLFLFWLLNYDMNDVEWDLFNSTDEFVTFCLSNHIFKERFHFELAITSIWIFFWIAKMMISDFFFFLTLLSFLVCPELLKNYSGLPWYFSVLDVRVSFKKWFSVAILLPFWVRQKNKVQLHQSKTPQFHGNKTLNNNGLWLVLMEMIQKSLLILDHPHYYKQ